MAFDTRSNFWSLRRDDGANRSHVPPQPVWHLFLRIAQLILAIIVVALVGYADDVFGATPDSFAYTFFVFAWTVLFLGWLLVSIFFFPVAYHPWAHVAVEIVTAIFWLACWATLAHDATQLSNYGGYYYYSGWGRLKRAVNCIKAAAAMGALTWVLFVVTVTFLVLSVLRTHRAAGPAGTAAAAEAGKPAAQPFEMAPVSGGQPESTAPAYPNNGQQGYYQQEQQHYQAQQSYEGQEQQTYTGQEYPQQPEQTHQHQQTHGSAPAPYPGT